MIRIVASEGVDLLPVRIDYLALNNVREARLRVMGEEKSWTTSVVIDESTEWTSEVVLQRLVSTVVGVDIVTRELSELYFHDDQLNLLVYKAGPVRV